ncbi:MAG: TraR/DksA C4-type zinc finger protein [Bacteroidota bacterium]|nr:TraR/DksA C4-type zinc finger protein [Bacteroidota bacterium]
MAIKKKQPARPAGGAPKKAAKPAPKKAASKKPVAKKTVQKAVPKKAAPKKAPPKPVAKKPAPKAVAKPVAKPAPKVAAKPELPEQKPAVKPVPVKPVKPGTIDPKSLVTIKQKVKPVIKKEPPKASKFIIPKTTTKSSVKYEPEFTKSVLDQMVYLPTGPTMRYSDNDLTEFREIIQKKLDAAKKELNYLQGLITRKEEGGDMDEGRYMTMEDGSVSMEREQLSQMASRQITFIDHLEKAMMRIENKTYGICRVTGKLIDKARLRAVPHATLSIEAKQMMNK